jgi:adenylate cyclase
MQEHPTWPPTYRFLAAFYGHLGQLEEAYEIVRRLRSITPIIVPDAAHWRKPEHRELFLSGLRVAARETA